MAALMVVEPVPVPELVMVPVLLISDVDNRVVPVALS